MPSRPELPDDLSGEALAAVLGERPVRSYPALVSTEAEAIAWACDGAPRGAVVAAGYQAAPRGRAGRPWELPPGEGLAFSLILRPDLPPARAGWLYTVGTLGLAAAFGSDSAVEWPDEVHRQGRRVGAVGIQEEVRGERLAWVVITLLAARAAPPRAGLLARIVGEVEARCAADPEVVLAEHQERVATLGRRVRARMAPGGPAATTFSGRAERTKTDGALVLRTDTGAAVAVPPRQLAALERPDGAG